MHKSKNALKCGSEVVWGTRVVFFGIEDQGKSTIMGYMRAKSMNMDMAKYAEKLHADLGSEYKLDYLYSSLINEVSLDSGSSYGGRYSTKKYNLKDFVVSDNVAPILITMIDTPGHQGKGHKKGYLNQAYGISKGNIGVFCIAINYLERENPDRIFERVKLWRAFHENEKYIILLTQFDRKNFSESAYLDAVEKIYEIIPREEVECIIPTAIDFTYGTEANIYDRSDKTFWYNGKTLSEAINEQHFKIANKCHSTFLPRDLVFSIDKEIARPRSKAGKVWRIFIENGILNLGEKIALTSINMKNFDQQDCCSTANGTVKDIRIDIMPGDESGNNTDCAPKGAVSTINLKDCYLNGKSCKKGDIVSTDQTIGFGENVKYEMINTFVIAFPDDFNQAFKINQQIDVFILGRNLPAQITEVISNHEITVKTIAERYFPLPQSDELAKQKIFNNIVVRVNRASMDFCAAKIELSKTRQINAL